MLPRALAVLAPLALLFVLSWWGGLFAPAEVWVQPPPSTPTARLIERLAAVPQGPEVVVLGNSQALSAVDMDALASALQVPGKVTAATIPAARAPVLYAVLKNTVFGAGYRPKLVVLPASLQHLLETELPEGERLTMLLEHLPAPDPVLEEKVFGRAGGWGRLDRALADARTARDAWLASLTSLPVTTLGALGGDDTPPAERMDAARDAVFGDVAGSNMVLNARMIPVVERGAGGPTLGADDLARSLVPDLVELCASYGARLVVVSVPQRMANLATPPALAHGLATWLADHDVGFLHLEGAPIPSDAWLDEGHMNARGRDAFTAALLAALVPMKPLSDHPLISAQIPLAPPMIRRTGPAFAPKLQAISPTSNPCVVHVKLDVTKQLADPFLSSHGFGYASPLTLTYKGKPLRPHATIKGDTGCVGAFQHGADKLVVALPAAEPAALADFVAAWDTAAPHARRMSNQEDGEITQDAWWVPAGGALTLTWDTPPALAEGDRLQLVLAELRDAKVMPLVTVAGRPMPLVRWGRLWTGELAMSPVEGALVVEVRSPPTGPDLFVRDLHFATATGLPQVAIGHQSDRPDLFVVGGGHEVRIESVWQPDVYTPPQTATADELTFRVASPHDLVSTPALVAAVGDPRFASCSPLEVRRADDTGDGPRPPTRHDKPGVVTARTGADGGAWLVGSKDKRMCSGHQWVKPGETAVIVPKVAKGLLIPADQLRVTTYAFTAGGVARVRLVVDGVAQVDAPLQGKGEELLPLKAQVGPWPETVTMEVIAPPDGWVAVGYSYLTAAEAPEAAWFTRLRPVVERFDAPEPAANASGAAAGGAPAAPRPTAPRPAPGALPMQLSALLQAGGATSFLALPPGASQVRVDGAALVMEGAPDAKPMVCTPTFPLGDAVLGGGQLQATLSVAQLAAERGVPVFLDLRWLDATGRPIKTAEGRPALTTARRTDLTPTASPMTVRGPIPDGLPTPPAQGQACLRRGPGATGLRVEAWTVEATP